MAEINNTLKKERIAETNTAANTDSSTVSKVDKTETKEETPSSENKNKKVRMIGYPVLIGGLGVFSGMFLADKLGKEKTWFVIGGVVVGASVGFLLYKNWEKRNS